METESAFLHLFGLRVELWRPVRAGLDAIFTPDADILVNQHNSIRGSFENRIIFVGRIVHIRYRARSHTGGVLAMITGAGHKRQGGVGENT